MPLARNGVPAKPKKLLVVGAVDCGFDMLVRFDCPACGGSHSFDMPETVIHMTCSRTHQVMELRLTKGGDVRAQIVGEQPSSTSDTDS